MLSEVEDSLEAEPEVGPSDPLGENELIMTERRLNRQIRLLENEIPKWQVLVESVTGISPPDFDPQTMAVLRGRLVRFLVRSREVSLGRSTKDSQVDIDLSLEGIRIGDAEERLLLLPYYKLVNRFQDCSEVRVYPNDG